MNDRSYPISEKSIFIDLFSSVRVLWNIISSNMNILGRNE